MIFYLCRSHMLVRLSYVFILCALAIAALLYVHFTRSGGEVNASYVGVNRCGTCHASASSGAQFKIWASGPHSKAYASLGSDSAMAYIRANGAAMEACLKCHSTLGRKALNPHEERVDAEGIGCERCHGPGGSYATYNVMKEREAFLDNGGIVGTLRDCYNCHAANPANDPHHCPFQHATFNADSAWTLIRHDVRTTAGQPDTVLKLREP